MIRRSRFLLGAALVASLGFTAACAGDSSDSPSAPSPTTHFSGTWTGTFGAGAVPITLTLTQSGSAVTGFADLQCSGCGRLNVQGTSSGTTATVDFTFPGDSSPMLRGATLTISGTTMSTRWTASDGTVVTGTLTVGPAGPTSPSPAPAPPPAPAGKYDGTYNFFFRHPGPGGTTESKNLSRYLIITNGVVSSSDGSVTGTVDGFGAIRFTSPCPINSSTADWNGQMNQSALAGFNFGEGQYSCRIAIGGGTNNTWQATQAR